MSNNKQSSVEWLVSQLKISTYWDTLIAQLELMDLEIDDIIEQAKAMEKKQCVDFALKCMFAHVIPSQATREVVERLFDEDNLQ